MIRAACILLTALLLSACAGPAPDSSRPTAWLKPGVKVTLPPPGIQRPVAEHDVCQYLTRGRHLRQRHQLLGMNTAGIIAQTEESNTHRREPRQINLLFISTEQHQQ